MGYSARPRKHPRHRKGRACQECIRELEIECGIRPRLPQPPKGPGPGARLGRGIPDDEGGYPGTVVYL